MRKMLLLLMLMLWIRISRAEEACINIIAALPRVAQACANSHSLCLVTIEAESEASVSFFALDDYLTAENSDAIFSQANQEQLSFALLRLPMNDAELVLLAYGNTRLENAVANSEIAVLAVRGVNLRAAPSVSAPVIASLSQGGIYSAVGRLADNTWIRVRLNTGEVGWVSAQYLRSERGFAALDAVAPNSPAYLPMQSLSLQTADACSALLLLAPQDEAVYEVVINGLILQLNGAALARIADSSIQISSFLGENSVSAFGFIQSVPENEMVTTPLSRFGTVAGIPAEAEVYEGILPPYRLFLPASND